MALGEFIPNFARTSHPVANACVSASSDGASSLLAISPLNAVLVDSETTAGVGMDVGRRRRKWVDVRPRVLRQAREVY